MMAEAAAPVEVARVACRQVVCLTTVKGPTMGCCGQRLESPLQSGTISEKEKRERDRESIF